MAAHHCTTIMPTVTGTGFRWPGNGGGIAITEDDSKAPLEIKAKPPANVITGKRARRIRAMLDRRKVRPELMAEAERFMAEYADDFTALADQ